MDGVRAVLTRKEQLDKQIEKAEGGPKVAMPPSKEGKMEVAPAPQKKESNASLLWRAITGKKKYADGGLVTATDKWNSEVGKQDPDLYRDPAKNLKNAQQFLQGRGQDPGSLMQPSQLQPVSAATLLNTGDAELERASTAAQQSVTSSGKSSSFGSLSGSSPAPGTFGSYSSGGSAVASSGIAGLGGNFASGGIVTGPAGKDRVPILATAGEVVLPTDTVKKVGVDKLDKLIKETHTTGKRKQ